MKLIGFYLSQVMAACEHPTNRFALSGGAAVVNIGAHALLLRSRSILSTGINDLRVSGLHPTPMQRMRALAYTDCYLAPEYKVWAGITRESLMRILNMVWRFSLPHMHVLYEAGQFQPIDLGRPNSDWLPPQ